MGNTSHARLRSSAGAEPPWELTFAHQAGADRVLGVYAGIAKGTRPIAPHRHEFWEVAVALAGRGYHEDEIGVIPILLGDVWVIAPGCWHAFTLGPERLLVFNLLLTTEFVEAFPFALEALTALSEQRLFEGVRSPMRDRPESPGHVQLPSLELERVRSLLTQLSEELQAPHLPGHVALCYGVVFQILGQLERSSTSMFGSTVTVEARGDPGLVQALRYIDSRYAEPVTLDELARHCGYANATLNRKFRHGVGLPPIEYLIRVRLRHACVLLERTDLSVTDVAGLVGFGDRHYFAARFRQELQLTPTQYRALATGQHCTFP